MCADRIVVSGECAGVRPIDLRPFAGAQGLEATGVSAKVSLDSGKLQISDLTADFLGGQHRGEWQADFSREARGLQRQRNDDLQLPCRPGGCNEGLDGSRELRTRVTKSKDHARRSSGVRRKARCSLTCEDGSPAPCLARRRCGAAQSYALCWSGTICTRVRSK